MGTPVSVWEDEKVLEIHSGDAHTTLRMHLMPLNHALKKGLNGILTSQLKKRKESPVWYSS